jgi:NitT/TauT family transport system substrate-binding protein
MVKVLMTTVLVASWLLGSCVNDSADLADSDPGLNCARPSTTVFKPSPRSARVRVGVTGALAEAAQYLADSEGYFARQGLSVQLINFTSASRMIPALSAGQLDVGSGNIGPGLFHASQNNLCVKIVAPLSRQEANASGVFLFVRRELVDSGSVRTYADLKGLHIGIPGRDNTSEYALAKLLETGGLGPKDVRIMQMSYPTILVSLANRSIDAAILPEAVATAAADKDLGVKWKPIADVVPGAEFGVVLFSPQFGAQHDVAVRWMAAYIQGARDYDAAFFHNVRRSEVVDQLTKVSPMKDRHMYDEMGFAVIDPNGTVNLDSVADQMRWFVQAGELPEAVDLSHVVDLSYVQEALERLGPYQ